MFIDFIFINWFNKRYLALLGKIFKVIAELMTLVTSCTTWSATIITSLGGVRS